MKSIINQEFYYIRHAQTDANANGLMCGGDWDIALNKTGHAQVEELSAKIESKGCKNFNLIVCSSMLRTRQTCEAINQELKLPVVYEKGLIEWCVGKWDKKDWKEVPNPFNTTEDPPGGETRAEFESRVIETVNSYLEKHLGKTLLFISHGAVAHSLFTFMGIDVPKIKNATLYRIRPVKRNWALEEVF